MQISTVSFMMISLFQFLISLIVGAVGIYAWVELKSFMKSTHQVQYVPLDNPKEDSKPILRDEDLNEYEI